MRRSIGVKGQQILRRLSTGVKYMQTKSKLTQAKKRFSFTQSENQSSAAVPAVVDESTLEESSGRPTTRRSVGMLHNEELCIFLHETR